MANPSVVINGVTYSSCPEVDIPKSGSGTAKFYYTGDANITSADVLTGKTGFGASGEVSGGMAYNGYLYQGWLRNHPRWVYHRRDGQHFQHGTGEDYCRQHQKRRDASGRCWFIGLANHLAGQYE